MAKDMNIGALRTNCFRQSKVKGEYMLQMRVPAGLIEAKYLGILRQLMGMAPSILDLVNVLRFPALNMKILIK